MYKIRFDRQPEQGYPDTEADSITLTHEQYLVLPLLSIKKFDEKCTFVKHPFTEQIRTPHFTFPAIWVNNDEWKLGKEYIRDKFYWVFVCLDTKKDIWIAFKYWDAITIEDMYYSTVTVSYPNHGDLYRLDESCMEIVRKFF